MHAEDEPELAGDCVGEGWGCVFLVFSFCVFFLSFFFLFSFFPLYFAVALEFPLLPNFLLVLCPRV
ncbi:hypothetical protein B0H13DRAFT_2122359 [Mycena leptocephala]|nr:hypothetical protein B0H13DRAFT_2122359 [Mycena leptocephala]